MKLSKLKDNLKLAHGLVLILQILFGLFVYLKSTQLAPIKSLSAELTKHEAQDWTRDSLGIVERALFFTKLDQNMLMTCEILPKSKRNDPIYPCNRLSKEYR